MPGKDSSSVACPGCARALPPGISRLCVYCGTALPPPARDGRGAAEDPRIGRTVAGRYRVESVIGQGGMGKVYRARHLALDRTVCLKMLNPAVTGDRTIASRFEREALAARRLNHPNSIQVLDFGHDAEDGALYLAMEYVEGKDLGAVLREEWPVPERRLRWIVAQALSALAEAHARNVVHRDLKPENIMVEQRRDHPDFVKVLDFGIAKILDSGLPPLTKSGLVCGTPQYMAPEQATGGKLDARTDLYAVGIILYQLATSHLPFDGPTPMEVLTSQVHDAPIPPRERQPSAPISEELESIILRALAKEPRDRPQSAEEFRSLLLPPARAFPRALPRPTEPAAGRRVKLAALVVVLFALAACWALF